MRADLEYLITLDLFKKSLTDKPEEKRAVPPVGSTWDGRQCSRPALQAYNVPKIAPACLMPGKRFSGFCVIICRCSGARVLAIYAFLNVSHQDNDPVVIKALFGICASIDEGLTGILILPSLSQLTTRRRLPIVEMPGVCSA